MTLVDEPIPPRPCHAGPVVVAEYEPDGHVTAVCGRCLRHVTAHPADMSAWLASWAEAHDCPLVGRTAAVPGRAA